VLIACHVELAPPSCTRALLCANFRSRSPSQLKKLPRRPGRPAIITRSWVAKIITIMVMMMMAPKAAPVAPGRQDLRAQWRAQLGPTIRKWPPLLACARTSAPNNTWPPNQSPILAADVIAPLPASVKPGARHLRVIIVVRVQAANSSANPDGRA